MIPGDERFPIQPPLQPLPRPVTSPAPSLQAALAAHSAGDLPRAEQLYRTILALQPDQGDALNLLGVLLHQTGRNDEAEQRLRRAVELLPKFADAQSNLAMVLMAQQRYAAAQPVVEQVLALAPNHLQGLFFHGALQERAGNFPQAAASYRQALTLAPGWIMPLRGLASAERALGNFASALGLYAEAARQQPTDDRLAHEIGQTLRALGRLEDAIASFRRAAALAPATPAHLIALGAALRQTMRFVDSRDTFAAVVASHPDSADGWNGLGTACIDLGDIERGIAALQRAVNLQPDNAGMGSGLLFALNYSEHLSAEAIFTAHRRWAARFTDQQAPLPQAPTRTAGRLRLGFLSADLRQHSVAHFLTPLLENIDRQRFEIFAYADQGTEDAVSGRLRACVDHWRPCHALDNPALARLIAGDELDFLVELSGHTHPNRLPALALRPARRLLTWLGYPNTTGMTQIGYRISDAVADPLATADALVSEQLIRLPGGFLCYTPLAETPAPRRRAPAPMVFGSFNNLSKISDTVLAGWAAILAARPEASLLLKNFALSDPQACRILRQRFEQHGGDARRLDLRGASNSTWEHLALYNEIDVALDTFPYHGTTTTCEALWMGVPVLTVQGATHAARVGASLLCAVGGSEWIVGSIEQLVNQASAMPATTTPEREALRQRMQQSALMDGQGFARRFSDALLQLP